MIGSFNFLRRFGMKSSTHYTHFHDEFIISKQFVVVGRHFLLGSEGGSTINPCFHRSIFVSLIVRCWQSFLIGLEGENSYCGFGPPPFCARNLPCGLYWEQGGWHAQGMAFSRRWPWKAMGLHSLSSPLSDPLSAASGSCRASAEEELSFKGNSQQMSGRC